MKYLNNLITRAKSIYKKGGTTALFRQGAAFLGLYEKSYFYSFRRAIYPQQEADFKPEIENMESKIITSGYQLDELINSGYTISLNIKHAKRLLKKSAIAFLG